VRVWVTVPIGCPYMVSRSVHEDRLYEHANQRSQHTDIITLYIMRYTVRRNAIARAHARLYEIVSHKNTWVLAGW